MVPALLIYLLAAQLQLSVVGGVVTDPAGRALPGAVVELADTRGAVLASTTTDGSGRFSFTHIAPGRYDVHTTVAGFAPATQSFQVSSALPIELTLRVAFKLVQVVIREPSWPEPPMTMASIAGDSIAAVPVRATARGIQEAVVTLPGWASEDNGLLHARGTDDGFLYVIDGVPVYERIDQVSGIGPDLASVESITVRTGYIPAEFGHKAGGIIDIRSKTQTTAWNASLHGDRASDASSSASALLGGPINSRLSVTIGVAGQRSDRFLDPVHPDNLHNSGQFGAVSSQIMWTRNDSNLVSASLSAGRSTFDVPNTEVQEAAGQDQRQRLRQANAAATWQRVWSARTFSQMAGYLRHSGSVLTGSVFDTPIFATADRALQRVGAIASVTRRMGTVDVKAGLEGQRLLLREDFRFISTDTPSIRPFVFDDRATPSLLSGFLQTDWQATDALTLSAGLRFDESRLLLARRQASPRAGVSYRVANQTVVRGSASRFFQPPQPENLLLASSEQARVLSPFAEDGDEGGAEVEPERQWGFEAGVDHRIGRGVRIDAAAWYRRISHVADPNVFAGTTIIFPNVVAEGRARGVDLRLELSGAQSWSGYLNAAIGSVRQKGPMVGGLFLDDEVVELSDGEAFTPDHDQRAVIGGGVTWRHDPSGASVSASARYESGTPIQREEDEEDDLRARPGAEMVNFEKGRVRPRTVVSVVAEVPIVSRGRRSIVLRASILNLFDAAYAYNFGNPFSGTHFGAPRTASAGLHLGF